MNHTSLFDRPIAALPFPLKVYSQPDQPGDDPLKYRSTSPVLYLRGVLDRLRNEFGQSRAAGTWHQYETLVSRWEEFFEGQGPPVHEITDTQLQEFFESVQGWNTATTWERYYTQLIALLKSCCARSSANKQGIPRDQPAPLRIDELPVLTIHSPEWFRANRVASETRVGGHTPKRRSTLTLAEFQKVVDAAWTIRLDLMDPVWWETLLGWLWFSGMRIKQARLDLRWCDDGQSEGIHLASRTIVTTETKCGGDISIPIPDSLIPGLTELHDRPKARRKRRSLVPAGYAAYVFRDTGVVGNTPFYEQWAKLWDAAIPVESDAERELKHFWPHELRAVSTTNWDLRPEPDCKAGWLVTGHQPSDVRTRCYFQPGDVRLREIVNRFDMPHLRATGRCEPTLF